MYLNYAAAPIATAGCRGPTRYGRRFLGTTPLDMVDPVVEPPPTDPPQAQDSPAQVASSGPADIAASFAGIALGLVAFWWMAFK